MKALKAWVVVPLLSVAVLGWGQPKTNVTVQSKNRVYRASVSTPNFGDSRVQALATKRFRVEAQRWMKDFLAEVDAMEKDPRPPFEAELKVTTTVGLNTPKAVSAYLTIFMWTGGAHPNTIIRPMTFGLRDGKPAQLKLADLLQPAVSPEMLSDQVVLPALNRVKAKRESELSTELSLDLLESFVATPAGVSWIFEPYAVGPYSDGIFTVKVLDAELKNLFRQPNALRN